MPVRFNLPKLPRFFKLLTSLVLMALTVQPAGAHAAAPPPQTLDELKTAIEKIRQETHTPAVGIALANKDGVQWVGGFGEANLAQHVKADENTRFAIGSVSKMFAAMAVLKLVEQGKLHLDDKVKTLLPDLAMENRWEASHPVLLAHLLEHTTGWEDRQLAINGWQGSDTVPVMQALAMHSQGRVSRWVPGTRTAYCNMGPVVAAAIVEKVSGIKFEDYVAANFFQPLQMHQTSYFNQPNLKAQQATRYSHGQAQGAESVLFRADGSVSSSAKEMGNFLALLVGRGTLAAGQSTPQTLLSAASLQRMETPATTLGSAKGVRFGYGLANEASGFDEYRIPFYGHNGLVRGSLTSLAYAPQLQRGYVLMLNTDDFGAYYRFTNVLNRFVLNGVSKPAASPANTPPLPAEFRQIDGWYQQISPRTEILRYISDVMSLTKFEVDGNRLLRTSLIEGDEESNTGFNEHLLQDNNSGLPAVAIVQDPLAGETVQVGQELYQRRSMLYVAGLLGFFGLWAGFALLNIAMVAWFGVRRMMARTGKPLNGRLLLLPLLATLLLVCAKHAGSIFGNGDAAWGTVSPTSLTTMLCSLAYAAVAVAGVWLAVRQIATHRLVQWHASAIALLHGGMLAYLMSYGMIGIRTWTH